MITAQIASWREQGTLWIWLGGGVALLILIIVLIIVGVMAHRKSKIREREIAPETFITDKRREAPPTIVDDGKNTPNNSPTNDDTVMDRMVNPEGTRNEPGVGTISLDPPEEQWPSEGEGGHTVMVEEDPKLEVELSERFVDRRSGVDEQRTPRVLLMHDGESITFGRSFEADQQIDDKTVSSRHMRLTCQGDALYIEDIGSSNGTKVNGAKLPVNEPRQLNDNDMILIGCTTLTVSIRKLDQ